MSKKIFSGVVAVCLNPALDVTGSLASLNSGTLNRVSDSDVFAAGKGINVAKVLANLGAQTTVTGFLGEENANAFERLFSDNKIIDAMIRVPGSCRNNIKLSQHDGLTTEINFPGFSVPPSALDALGHTLSRLAQEHDLFVISGSLPSGISPVRLAGWIHFLCSLGKTVYFDSSGEALSSGINAKPALIKPNQEEFSEWLGEPDGSITDFRNYSQRLMATGIENVVVSLGDEGAVWLRHGEWIKCDALDVDIVSTVGAGDSLLAGFCWGYLQGWSQQKTFRFAIALSASAVSQVGVGVSDITDITRRVSEVNLSPI
ncbi:1-phosphofructokinase [Veronia pacifica]|uniref:Phosphofructokinase n=1 Tax=Veronia pacifica TaxID=1080227 RepID=A0A1C3EIC6_9GAMM|nr:1-phosphofructokinase [Veronia pacifica]ODA32980.1 1-phosphofructokinase [Veronia pacifica]